MNESQLQARIDALPREHEPRRYEVLLFDRRDRFVSRRFVRASSPERAKLTGYKVERFVFGGTKAFRATVAPQRGSLV